MILEKILFVVGGYIFGLFQTAFIYGKMKGIDIREHGSGNAGTTNTLRVLGTKAGLIVFAGDAGKCAIAVTIARFVSKAFFPEYMYLFMLYTALGVILGHNFPFYMSFKGGKGIASTAGLILSIHPLFIPVGAICFIVPFAITKYVSLGSLLINLGFFVEMILLGQWGLLGQLPQNTLFEMYAITFVIACMAFIRHRANIGRLLHGNERKTYLFTKKTE